MVLRPSRWGQFFPGVAVPGQPFGATTHSPPSGNLYPRLWRVDTHSLVSTPTNRQPPSSAHSLVWENRGAAALTGLIALAQACLSRWQVNPDGVAYLDLADALGARAWVDVAQGYWSPLYPMLLAVATSTFRMVLRGLRIP